MPAHNRSLPTRMYHILEVGNWPLIQTHGLLSAQALLDLVQMPVSEQTSIHQQQRLASLVLSNGAFIRDQGPMPPEALKRCLVDMTPAQWYTLLNSKVFFWFDVGRLNRLRLAMKSRPQIVLTVDTQRLLEGYAEQVTLTPINTGNARRKAALRSAHSFVPYMTWLQSGWDTETAPLGTRPRLLSHEPVELTVAYGIPNIMEYVVDICHLEPGEIFPH